MAAKLNIALNSGAPSFQELATTKEKVEKIREKQNLLAESLMSAVAQLFCKHVPQADLALSAVLCHGDSDDGTTTVTTLPAQEVLQKLASLNLKRWMNFDPMSVLGACAGQMFSSFLDDLIGLLTKSSESFDLMRLICGSRTNAFLDGSQMFCTFSFANYTILYYTFNFKTLYYTIPKTEPLSSHSLTEDIMGKVQGPSETPGL